MNSLLISLLIQHNYPGRSSDTCLRRAIPQDNRKPHKNMEQSKKAKCFYLPNNA